jgi:hypothetical protein
MITTAATGRAAPSPPSLDDHAYLTEDEEE